MYEHSYGSDVYGTVLICRILIRIVFVHILFFHLFPLKAIVNRNNSFLLCLVSVEFILLLLYTGSRPQGCESTLIFCESRSSCFFFNEDPDPAAFYRGSGSRGFFYCGSGSSLKNFVKNYHMNSFLYR